jgi:hypothetical protein
MPKQSARSSVARRGSVLVSRRASVLKAPPTETLFLFGEENQEDLGEYVFYTDPDSETGQKDNTDTTTDKPTYKQSQLSVSANQSIPAVEDDYDMTAAMGTQKRNTAGHLSIQIGSANGSVKKSMILSTTQYSPSTPSERLLTDPGKGSLDREKREKGNIPPAPRRPWFLWLMTFLQIIGMGLSFFFAWQNTGSPIQTEPFNCNNLLS